MIGNRLDPRFKNPFDVTVNQAIGAGGGESRQAVNRRQHALKKIRIDGQWLIKIKAGSKVNNRPALYEINYNLIVPSHIAAPVFERQPSQKQDGLDDGYDDGVQDGLDDDNRTILRSDQRRGEETTPPTPPNLASTQESEKTENGAGGVSNSQEEEEKPKMITMAKNLQDLILRKWQRQISEGPDIGACKQALREFGHRVLVGAINQAPNILEHPKPTAALNLVIGVAKRIRDEGSGGVSPALIAEREKDIAELKSELAEAKKNPEENEMWISQNQFLLRAKQTALESLKGEG